MSEAEDQAALLKKFEEGVAELHRQASALADVRKRCIEAGLPAELLAPSDTLPRSQASK